MKARPAGTSLLTTCKKNNELESIKYRSIENCTSGRMGGGEGVSIFLNKFYDRAAQIFVRISGTEYHS